MHLPPMQRIVVSHGQAVADDQQPRASGVPHQPAPQLHPGQLRQAHLPRLAASQLDQTYPALIGLVVGVGLLWHDDVAHAIGQPPAVGREGYSVDLAQRFRVGRQLLPAAAVGRGAIELQDAGVVGVGVEQPRCIGPQQRRRVAAAVSGQNKVLKRRTEAHHFHVALRRAAVGGYT